jgi:hypothetical protein
MLWFVLLRACSSTVVPAYPSCSPRRVDTDPPQAAAVAEEAGVGGERPVVIPDVELPFEAERVVEDHARVGLLLVVVDAAAEAGKVVAVFAVAGEVGDVRDLVDIGDRRCRQGLDAAHVGGP